MLIHQQDKIWEKNFDSIIMLRSRKTKVGKEEFCWIKKQMKFWDIDVNNIVILTLIEIKKNSKYLVRYLDETISSDMT